MGRNESMRNVLTVKSTEILLGYVFKLENNSKTVLSKTINKMNWFMKFYMIHRLKGPS